MLFAAGIGIGLMFFGVSEPVEHFLQPPLGLEAADTAAARLGIASAIYHWGIHGWAMYAVVALSIAFASYNLGLPLTLRSALYPLMGEAVWGRFGHGIDTLAVFATLFGLATSLGLGAQQAAGGLAYLLGALVHNSDRGRELAWPRLPSSGHLAIRHPERRHGVENLAPDPCLDSLCRQPSRSHR